MHVVKGLFYNFWKLYIGIIFVLTLFIFYPIIVLILIRDDWKKHTFKVNILWSRCMRILCFYAVETNDFKLSTNEPMIIIANHTSYLDIFLLYSILPNHRFLFMGKSELLRYPLVKTFFTKLNIPVDRSSSVKSAKSFIRAKKEIANGWSIVIFPEGGILEEGPSLHPFKNGAFQLAKASGCAILPITFINNYKLFSDPTYLTASAYPGIAKVHIHPCISKDEVQSVSLEEIKNKAYSQIHSVLQEE